MIKGNLNTRLIERLKAIPEPASYYRGTAPVELVLPDNIIVVGRNVARLPSCSSITHHRFLMALSLGGAGGAILDGARFHIPPDHCLLVFPHQHHHFFYDESIRWFFITFELRQSDAIEILRNRTLPFSGNCLEYLEMLTRDYYGSEKLDSNGIAKLVLFASLILHELIYLARERKDHNISEEIRGDALFVDRVNKFIYSNLERSLVMSELARQFSCSSSHLRARYRKGMGISLGKYIKEMRLHKAQSYLANTDMSVGEVAEACGYDSLYSFSHAFKNYSGVSPLEFRQAMKRKALSVQS